MAGTEKIRVATLNVWGNTDPWEPRRPVLIDGLLNLQADIIAFQEAIKTEVYDQVHDLLGSDFQVIYQTNRAKNGSGLSIASRWPVSEVHEVDLHVTPRTMDFACEALVAKIILPEPIGPLLFINHLPSWQLNFEFERELQTVIAARFIEEQPELQDMHVILAGDFDADPEASSVRFWSGRQALGGMSVCYRDAWESVHRGEPGDTFTPDNDLVYDWDWPFRRIDYIFVRCGPHGGPTLVIASCERIFDKPVGGVWASDHFGVVADLIVPPRPTSL